MSPTRRSLLAFPVLAWLTTRPTAQAPVASRLAAVPTTFPAQDPAQAREMVSVSHGNLARVRELVGAHPALAKAAWDWGYGDWETALGAASHVGNREIAELLLASGAGPTLFSAAMLGELETVRAAIVASPGIQGTKGPHGISLLAHAKAGGVRAAEVVKYLESVGHADPRYTNEPLTEADERAVAGRYAFGPGAADALTIAAGPRGLTITRDGGAARGMLHLGRRVFHPVGAQAVRLRLQGSADRASVLIVEDGPLVVTATRLD